MDYRGAVCDEKKHINIKEFQKNDDNKYYDIYYIFHLLFTRKHRYYVFFNF